MWYETPDRSLVDKRPVHEVISIWWWACDKTNSTSKAAAHKTPYPLQIASILPLVWCLRHKHCRPPTTLFLTCFQHPYGNSNFGASVTITAAVDYREYSMTGWEKNRKLFTSGGNGGMGGRTKRDWDSESRRQGGPATCDRGQVRVGTHFTLNEDEVSYLPAACRIWTCPWTPTLFWVRHREMLIFCRLQNDTRMVEHWGSIQIIITCLNVQ